MGALDVALVLHGQPMLFELAIAREVLAVDRADLAGVERWYDVVSVGVDRAVADGAWLVPDAPLAALGGARTVVVPSWADPEVAPPAVLTDALAAAHAGGARIVALCTGAFVLAAAGLLDGRRATTHWAHAGDLATRHPLVTVDPDVLYVDEGSVLTSAGKAAAVDLLLHLVRLDLGAAAANAVARSLVLPPHRSGGQVQFVPPLRAPRPAAFGDLLDWCRARLDGPLGVAEVARHAGLSTRQLTRRFLHHTGRGPGRWLADERVRQAQVLLETTDLPVEEIARRCGLGTATSLRRRFREALGVSPSAYRSTFGG